MHAKNHQSVTAVPKAAKSEVGRLVTACCGSTQWQKHRYVTSKQDTVCKHFTCRNRASKCDNANSWVPIKDKKSGKRYGPWEVSDE